MAGNIVNENLDSSEVVVFLPICVHYILPIAPACDLIIEKNSNRVLFNPLELCQNTFGEDVPRPPGMK